MKTITKNGMTVSWEFNDGRIYFEMKAPTDGWVAIGFNNNESTTGNYLLMGNVIEGITSVKEHYTISPGNYKMFSTLHTAESIENIEGYKKNNTTKIKFSLPIISNNKYSKDLNKGNDYILLMAFSQEDDFQHHSIIHTATKITL
jgi:hypothetical protein